MKSRKNMIIIIALIVAVVGGALAFSFVRNMGSADDNPQETVSEADKTDKVFTYSEGELIATNEYYHLDVNNFKATLGEYVAYSLDYNAQVPCSNGETLSKQDGLSAIVTAAILFGYPTFSPEDMGVETEEEAIMATQFAVWRLAQANGVDESKSSEYIFDMNNLMAKEGYEESLERIKVTAQGLVDIALKEPYYASPLLNIGSEDSKIRFQDNQMIVGPYTIKATGYNVKDIHTSLVDAPKSAVLCDIDGNVKKHFENGEDIYIRLNNNVGEITFTLRLDTTGNHYAGVVYGTGAPDDNKQNFCAVETFDDELDMLVEITLPKLSTGDTESGIEGYLKVISVDETKEKLIAGITYEILNEDGIVLETLVSDENGEILSQKLLKGTYYFREIAGPNNIHIDSTKYEFKIEEDNTVEVYTLLHYPAKGKLSISFTDQDSKPVEGVEVQVLDEKLNIVDTICSDANGMAESKYLSVGNYFYKQISVPDGIVIDSTMYDFALTRSMYVLKVSEECELIR